MTGACTKEREQCTHHREVHDAPLPDVVEEEAVVDVGALGILVRNLVEDVLRHL